MDGLTARRSEWDLFSHMDRNPMAQSSYRGVGDLWP
jgi:hypothetical protein